jgi:cell division protein FtsW
MSERRDTVYAGGANARYWLLGSAVFLMVFGLVMIYSASSVTALAKEGNSWIYLAKQLVFIALGWAVAIVLGRFDYRLFRQRSMLVWAGAVALLVVVLLYGFVSHGARRWIPLGLFNLQPSELAKVACVIAVAAVAIEWQRGRLDTKAFGTRALMLTAVPAALIMLQPDMGTTATLIVAVVLVLVLAGIPMLWVAGSTAGLVALGAVFIFAEQYRLERFLGFLDPWKDPAGKGYQTIQALYAFGTGGLQGVGLGLSRQKFFYLPEAHTDFILAIIGEEAGLIGTLAVVVGFAIFVWAGIRIAAGARDDFGHLIAGGITGMLAFQAVVNMAAVTGMMPVTGKPLPFVSYGGSSMLVTMTCLGLLLSVSRYGARAPRAVRSQPRVQEGARESNRDGRRDGGAHLPRADRGRSTRRRA